MNEITYFELTCPEELASRMPIARVSENPFYVKYLNRKHKKRRKK